MLDQSSGAAEQPRSPRERLYRIYRTYAPERIPYIDTVLFAYANREAEMLATATATYGPEPSDGLYELLLKSVADPAPADTHTGSLRSQEAEGTPNGGTAAPWMTACSGTSTTASPPPLDAEDSVPSSVSLLSSSTRRPSERLMWLMMTYCPEHILKLDDILYAYRSDPTQMLADFVEMYGPEPKIDARKQRLLRFYEYYCPEKISSVDHILLAYAAEPEAKLFEDLARKYGPEPSPYCTESARSDSGGTVRRRTRGHGQASSPPDDEKKSSSSGISATFEFTRNRLLQFYQHYCSHKMALVDDLLQTYTMHPRGLRLLFSQLEEKYGPEIGSPIEDFGGDVSIDPAKPDGGIRRKKLRSSSSSGIEEGHHDDVDENSDRAGSNDLARLIDRLYRMILFYTPSRLSEWYDEVAAMSPVEALQQLQRFVHEYGPEPTDGELMDLQRLISSHDAGRLLHDDGPADGDGSSSSLLARTESGEALTGSVQPQGTLSDDATRSATGHVATNDFSGDKGRAATRTISLEDKILAQLTCGGTSFPYAVLLWLRRRCRDHANDAVSATAVSLTCSRSEPCPWHRVMTWWVDAHPTDAASLAWRSTCATEGVLRIVFEERREEGAALVATRLAQCFMEDSHNTEKVDSVTLRSVIDDPPDASGFRSSSPPPSPQMTNLQWHIGNVDAAFASLILPFPRNAADEKMPEVQWLPAPYRTQCMADAIALVEDYVASCWHQLLLRVTSSLWVEGSPSPSLSPPPRTATLLDLLLSPDILHVPLLVDALCDALDSLMIPHHPSCRGSFGADNAVVVASVNALRFVLATHLLVYAVDEQEGAGEHDMRPIASEAGSPKGAVPLLSQADRKQFILQCESKERVLLRDWLTDSVLSMVWTEQCHILGHAEATLRSGLEEEELSQRAILSLEERRESFFAGMPQASPWRQSLQLREQTKRLTASFHDPHDSAQLERDGVLEEELHDRSPTTLQVWEAQREVVSRVEREWSVFTAPIYHGAASRKQKLFPTSLSVAAAPIRDAHGSALRRRRDHRNANSQTTGAQLGSDTKGENANAKRKAPAPANLSSSPPPVREAYRPVDFRHTLRNGPTENTTSGSTQQRVAAPLSERREVATPKRNKCSRSSAAPVVCRSAGKGSFSSGAVFTSPSSATPKRVTPNQGAM